MTVPFEKYLEVLRYALDRDIAGRYEFTTSFAHLDGMKFVVHDLTHYVDEIGCDLEDLERFAKYWLGEALETGQYCIDHPELFDEADPDDEDAENKARPEYWEGVADAWKIVLELI